MKGKYYAAYGSNLNMEQMSRRCPSAVPAGTALLKDYGLLFKGSKTGSYLTVEKMPGAVVPLGLWRVTEAHERALDRYEGFPRFYYKRTFLLDCSDGKRHRCMIYIMHEDRPIGIPDSDYMEICRQGYDDFGFDHKFLKEAYAYSFFGRRYTG